MPGLIIIEGPDGCGKTTLANKLFQKEGGDYVHLTYQENIWDYQTKELWRAIEHCHERLVIVDRHWPSEQVYAKVYRNGSVMAHSARAMDRVIRKHAGLYVFAVPLAGDRVEQRFNELRRTRDELYSSGMLDVWRQFASLYFGATFGRSLGLTTLPCVDYADDIAYAQNGMSHRADALRYDMDTQTPNQGANEALERLAFLRAEQYWPALSTGTWNLAGNLLTAKVLFVGETPHKLARINLRDEPWRGVPFYGNDKCSAYLNSMLHVNLFDETSAMWTNAFADDGTDHLGQLVERGLVPIALGKKALKKVAEVAPDEYHYLPHPAYWQRFRHHELREYSWRLSSILDMIYLNQTRKGG